MQDTRTPPTDQQNSPTTTDIPEFDMPEDTDLTTEQALAIIDEWGNTSAVDVNPERGTATVSTPPMSVEQIALIVLHAAKHGTSVSAYLSYCGRNNGYTLDPAFVRERVADDGHLQDYRASMQTLQQILDKGEILTEEKQ